MATRLATTNPAAAGTTVVDGTRAPEAGDVRARFEEVRGWLKLPAGWRLVDPSSVAVDSAGRVYVVHRGDHPLFVVNPDGTVLGSIADALFSPRDLVEPSTQLPARTFLQHWLHGLFIDPEDNLWITEIGLSVVLKLTVRGDVLLRLGTPDQTGESPEHFYQPTDVAIGPSGDIYVSDGYGNSRVVRFGPDGRFVSAWGRRGDGSGEFHTPHGIAVGPDGNVYVAERLNHRVQVFDPDGRFLWIWPDVPRADSIRFWADGAAYVGSGRDAESFRRFRPGTDDREVLATRDQIGYPHGFCFDQAGDLYAADPIAHTVRRFRRLGASS